jgi:RHS repeat-associated protein
MPRLSPLWSWSRVILTRAVELTLVLVVLLAPRLLLAATPRSSGAMPVSPGRGSSSTARVDADASSPTTPRMLDDASTSPSEADVRRDSANSASRFIFVTITHAGNGSASVYTNASGSTSFTVTNTGSAGTVLFTVTDCTGNITNCSPSPAAGYLGAGWSMPVSVSFAAGMTAGSGSFILKAWDQSNNSFMASYAVNVTVTADPNAPTVSLAPHVGDRRDVSQCVADCFEATLSYTLPAYVSLDVPRSATLLYRSGSAYPHGKLSMDVTAASAPAGSTFRLRLRDSTGTYVMFPNQATSLFFARKATGATPIVAEFDATQIPTSARLYTAEVSTIKSDGSVFGTSLATVRIIILNDRNSPFGAGVRVVGIQRMSTTTGGVLVTDGSGSAVFFAGNCGNVNVACAFTSPAGELSKLSTANGFYRRVYPDSSSVWFYSGGHHRSSLERFGSATYIDYGWNAPYGDYVPTAITDPTGQSITFWYRDPGSLYGAWKDGSLGNIHTPMGDAPIGIDGANNAREWVELGGGTYRWRMKYGAQSLLDTAFDKASASYKHVYRYGATLAYTDAPAVAVHGGGTPRPRVTLRNAGDALLLGGATVGNGTSASPLAVPADMRAIVIGPRGDSTYLSLNRFGAPRKTYVPLTPSDSVEYDDATGLVTRTISPTGMDVRYTWSANKLVKVQNVTLNAQDSIVYETQYSLPKQVISSTSAGQWFAYDQTKTGWPLLTTRLGSSNATPTTHYADAFGRDTAVVDPGGHVTKSYYAASGLRNVDSVRAPNAQVTRFGRDGWGRVVSSTAPTGAFTSTALDILNRPAWVSGPLYNDTTRYQYDLLNNVTSVTDATSQVYTYQRNALGWVTKLTHPGTLGSDSTAYDIAGNPVYVKTRGNRQIELTYDLLGRLRKKWSLASNDSVTFSYDPAGRWMQAKSVEGGSTVVSIDTIYFDSLGRTTKAMADRPGTGYWRVVSQYNTTNGARAGVSVFKGANGAAEYTDGFQYDGLQRPSHITIQNYLSTRFTYDTDQLRDTVVYSSYYGSPLRETWEYTRDHALARRSYNVTAVQNALHRAYRSDSLARLVERSIGTTGKFQNFSYDIEGRLAYWIKKHQTGTPTCVNDPNGWGYDCSGSGVLTDSTATALYDNVRNPTDLGATIDSGNRLKTFNGDTMTYDADGQLVRKKTGTVTDSLVWDDFGQLKAVRRNGTLWATFNYDGFGRRVRKWTSTNSTVRYVWDGDQIILETNPSGVTTRAYSYQPGTDRLHAVTAASGETYYASIEPATGDINGLIRATDNAVVAQYAYTPWGQLEVDSTNIGNSLRWKGLVYDRETGLYYMRARYYDPKIRRFISEDPIGLEGGINVYAFASGDPVNRSDPSGLDDWYDAGGTVCIISGTRTYVGGELAGETIGSITCLPPGPRGPSLPMSQGQGGPPAGPTGQNTGGGNSGLTEAEKIARVDELTKQITEQHLNFYREVVLGRALAAARVANTLALRARTAIEARAARVHLAIINNPVDSFAAGYWGGLSQTLYVPGTTGAPPMAFGSPRFMQGWQRGVATGLFIKNARNAF